jgi:hypothetical protein
MNNNKYMPVKITKMYRGFADARCYIVDACQRSNMGIEFTFEGESRFVHPEEIDKGEVTAQGLKPKYPLPDGRKTFSLVSWKWSKLAKSKEERMHEVKQMDLFY